MWELYTFLKFIEPSKNSISVYLHFSHISTLMKYTEPWELQAPPATEQVQFRMTRHKKVLFYMWASLFSLLHPSLLRTISSTFIHFPSPPNPPPISKPFRLRLTVLQQPLEKSRLLSLRNPPPRPIHLGAPGNPSCQALAVLQRNKKHEEDCRQDCDQSVLPKLYDWIKLSGESKWSEFEPLDTSHLSKLTD